MRFLVVDDELGPRIFLEHILSMHFQEAVIDVSSDPVEALKKIKDNGYALVLSDFDMKPMTGAELCQSARDFRPDTRFIIISGNYWNETPARAVGADFIAKPYNFLTLMALVKKYVSSPQGS